MPQPLNLPRYQILVAPDSKKVQGLRTGDIVRRQYFDGVNVIYSLMCVLSYGTTQKTTTEVQYNPDGSPVLDSYGNIATQVVTKEVPYFTGALLEGDAPMSSELLDFARITNLFDVDRSGALYLTASDDEAPYMDVIDGIGKNKSLSWPEGISNDEYEDSRSQYVVHGDGVEATYSTSAQDNGRVVHIARNNEASGFCGLEQDFYELVQAQKIILVSYKARANRTLSIDAEVAYTTSKQKDAKWTENFDRDWKYCFQAVQVVNSGRHLRSFRLDLQGLSTGDWVEISDFNIILLDSISNFGEAASIRLGKLDGISDPVFGQLEGYGAYIQRLYASKTAHISGTLTAGDENGFASTFYAGKIHRNCFKNSCEIPFTGSVVKDNRSIANPTGMGNVYRVSSDTKIVMRAQEGDWLEEHIGQRYCFSFWCYAKNPCNIVFLQNNWQIKTFSISSDNTHEWVRLRVPFTILKPVAANDILRLALSISFSQSIYETEGGFENRNHFFITAPQLEKGEECTQYQPTDDILNYTEDYGGWFALGGIGGTIQNPLLRLNYDGEGAIDTRTNSFRLNQDGSGFLANRNIKWDQSGKITFGSDVTLNWDNLGDDTKSEISYKTIHITGANTFTIIGDDDMEKSSSPSSIVLTAEQIGFKASTAKFQWYYCFRGEFLAVEDATSPEFEILPFDEIWDNESTLVVKCVAILDDNQELQDTFTISKQVAKGLSVVITSSQGEMFRNGECETILTANLYRNGILVTDEEFLSSILYVWYKVDDEEPEMLQNSDSCELSLDYSIVDVDKYVCEIYYKEYFCYTFPITFEITE